MRTVASRQSPDCVHTSYTEVIGSKLLRVCWLRTKPSKGGPRGACSFRVGWAACDLVATVPTSWYYLGLQGGPRMARFVLSIMRRWRLTALTRRAVQPESAPPASADRRYRRAWLPRVVPALPFVEKRHLFPRIPTWPGLPTGPPWQGRCWVHMHHSSSIGHPNKTTPEMTPR